MCKISQQDFCLCNYALVAKTILLMQLHEYDPEK